MTRKLRLIAIGLWRFHRRSLLVGLSSVLVLTGLFVAIGASCSDSRSCGDVSSLDSDVPARVVLDRVWFSAFPEDERADFDIWLWTSSGIGLYQHGSSYRGSWDLVEVERRGASLDMVFLQDGTEARADFSVERCDAMPPFDLCLTLSDSPRGPARYYGFTDEESYATHARLAATVRTATGAAQR